MRAMSQLERMEERLVAMVAASLDDNGHPQLTGAERKSLQARSRWLATRSRSSERVVLARILKAAKHKDFVVGA